MYADRYVCHAEMFHLFSQLFYTKLNIGDAVTCNEEGLSPNSPMDSNTAPGDGTSNQVKC